jgi:YbgC/YbaW family acyl-CoA thioester hydrolase
LGLNYLDCRITAGSLGNVFYEQYSLILRRPTKRRGAPLKEFEMLDSLKKVYEFPVSVEFEDVDSYKIVHHTRFIAYLERARVHFLTDLGFDLYPEDLSIVLYSLEVRFKKPAFLLDLLIVSVFVTSMDEFRLELGYKIKRGKELLLRGTSGIAFMDCLTREIVPAPQKYTEKIRQFVI